MVFKLKSATTGRSGGGAVQEAGLGTWPTQLEKVERESEARQHLLGRQANAEQVDSGQMR